MGLNDCGDVYNCPHIFSLASLWMHLRPRRAQPVPDLAVDLHAISLLFVLFPLFLFNTSVSILSPFDVSSFFFSCQSPIFFHLLDFSGAYLRAGLTYYASSSTTHLISLSHSRSLHTLLCAELHWVDEMVECECVLASPYRTA